jgi:hypothetical protein
MSFRVNLSNSGGSLPAYSSLFDGIEVGFDYDFNSDGSIDRSASAVREVQVDDASRWYTPGASYGDGSRSFSPRGSSLPAGNHRVRVVVDPNNEVPGESDENSVSGWVSFSVGSTVTPPPVPPPSGGSNNLRARNLSTTVDTDGSGMVALRGTFDSSGTVDLDALGVSSIAKGIDIDWDGDPTYGNGLYRER